MFSSRMMAARRRIVKEKLQRFFEASEILYESQNPDAGGRCHPTSIPEG
jgi:hypothetical protein